MPVPGAARLASLLLTAASIAALPCPARGADVVGEFVERHCVGCHDEASRKGGLDLSSVSTNVADAPTFATWVKVHDRVRDGEMPPKAHDERPAPADTAAMLRELDARLHDADAARQQREGRARARRLNRDEYQNSLRDLLGVEGDYRGSLPEDGSAQGFDKVGSGLGISPEHLEGYLAAVEAALNEVIVTGPPPRSIKRRIPQRHKTQFPVVSFRERWAFLFYDAPDALVRFSGLFDAVAGTRVNTFGLYRVRIRARSWQSPEPMRARIRAGNPGDNGGNGVPWLVGYHDFPPEGDEVEYIVRLQPGHAVRVAPYGLARRPMFVPRQGKEQAKKAQMKTAPGPRRGLAMEWVEIEGPLHESWPPPAYRRLFGDLDLDDAGRDDAERVLRAFLPRAFRRPVTDDEVRHYLAIYDSAAGAGGFAGPIRLVLKAVLCSPHFLFLEAPPGPLDDHALAARLAYFLWSATPDAPLLAAAADGRLHEPETLHRQVERMLDDPRASALSEGFTGQWLDLRKITATSPDAQLYPEYDELLEYAMVQETRLFFDEVLKKNLSVANFIRSDFTIVNDRLAQHYGIDGVVGVDMRRVELPPESVRGGVLTQASVLKVTANGTTTSPVTRGAWVLDRILGTPAPPPPANVPAIEPDVRGARSIRDQLARHRTSASCAACHAKIDPPGFALERFDVIGGRRDRYRADPVTAPERTQVAVPEKKARTSVGLGPKVDASGALPDGRAFRDFDEFRTLLAGNPDRFVRTLAGKLLTYATGAAPQYADRAEIDRIVDRVRGEGRGFRSLIHAVVASPVFLQQ